jgi:lipopolysaccharide transport system ATP-binding protein
MGEVAGQGRTVLFVSHQMGAVRSLCTRAMLIEGGRIALDGTPEACISRYIAPDQLPSTILSHGESHCDHVVVRGIQVDGSRSDHLYLTAGSRRVTIEVEIELYRAARVNLEARLYDLGGVALGFLSPGHEHGARPELDAGVWRLKASMELPRLNRGDYFIGLSLTDPDLAGYWTFPNGVRLSCEGWPLANGDTFPSGDHCGRMLLDGDLKTYPAGQKDAFAARDSSLSPK